jgi:DNA-binding transcriptional MocR family regulator
MLRWRSVTSTINNHKSTSGNHQGVSTPLREGIRQGGWSGPLPGVRRLAAELDVAPRRVRHALGLLEAEGLLGGRGLGCSRGITAARTNAIRPPLRVAIPRHDVRLADNSQSSLFLTEIMHSLEAAGHSVFFCKKSQLELKHEVLRLTRHLGSSSCHGWESPFPQVRFQVLMSDGAT